MNTDTLQSIADSVAVLSSAQSHSANWWMWAALIEALLIVVLLVARGRTKPDSKAEAKRKVMAEGDVDFKNVINSTFHAQELYKKLIVKCHPDRFEPDASLVAEASRISTLVTENKNNLKQLQILKAEAEEKLKINIV